MSTLDVRFSRAPLVARLAVDGVELAGPSVAHVELRLPLVGALRFSGDAIESSHGDLPRGEHALALRLRLPGGLRTRAQRVTARLEADRLTLSTLVVLSIVRWLPAAELVLGMRAPADVRFDGVPLGDRRAREEHAADRYTLERAGRRLVASVEGDAWVRARLRSFAAPDGLHGFVLRIGGRLPSHLAVALVLRAEPA